jgi:hypothetical protein
MGHLQVEFTVTYLSYDAYNGPVFRLYNLYISAVLMLICAYFCGLESREYDRGDPLR